MAKVVKENCSRSDPGPALAGFCKATAEEKLIAIKNPTQTTISANRGCLERAASRLWRRGNRVYHQPVSPGIYSFWECIHVPRRTHMFY